MKLLPAFQAIALKLQEDATDLSHNDIRSRLSDALDDGCYVCDVFGDDDSGDVVYHDGDGAKKASYQFSTVNGKQVATVDTDNAVEVTPRTTYDEQPDDDDSYASMESAFKKAKLYTELPIYERFISKDERDNADSKDFAGKGKSYPILKPGDVMAAVRSMGRAGSDNVGTSTLKKNIIAIAKRKCWTKYLPKAWQGDSTEAQRGAVNPGELRLTESAATLEPIVLREARADYEIKLIAPGKGSSAFYPKEVLQRDGPRVFKAGTHVYLNHPTAAEEAARPEGDVKNLAGVLATDAVYQENHAKGPGLYARMKVFADHGQIVEEKAPHVGMSIRASGKAESNRTQGGLPVLKELTSAESVDVVTRAGAGGMILTEAARPHQEGELTLQEAQKLINDGIAAATAPMVKRLQLADAREEANAVLESVTLPPAAKARIVKRVLAAIPTTAEGAIDTAKLRESIVKEAKSEGEYLATVTGSGRVFGMGAAPVVQLDENERKRLKEEKKERKKEAIDVFESIGMPSEAAKIAAKGRVA